MCLIISGCLAVIVFAEFVIPNFEVQYAIAKPNDYHQETFFKKFNGEKFFLDKIYIYKYNTIREYSFAAGESLANVKFDLFDNRYHMVNNHKVLAFHKNRNEVIFDSKRLNIDYENGDTIISKINENEIILFIKK